jgi:hypothetical protein
VTDEEMVAALTAKGWKVDPPWSSKTSCMHPQHMRYGSGSLSCDGSSRMTWTCQACGYTEMTESSPRAKFVQKWGLSERARA